jgi:hypothetical protein
VASAAAVPDPNDDTSAAKAEFINPIERRPEGAAPPKAICEQAIT